MKQEFTFEDKHQFLEKLKELVAGGVNVRNLAVYTPFPVHEAEEILRMPVSAMRFFTLVGALSGLFFGLFLTIWTSLDYPLIAGGKPIVSMPAFIIVTFEMTILFGGIISFIGFLILGRFPAVRQIMEPQEYGNLFVIQIHEEEGK